MIAISIWQGGLVALGALAVLAAWWLRRHGHEIHSERARESFRLQRERLERLFFDQASSSGLPRGLTWTACQFQSHVVFAREPATRQIVALVSVTVEFAAIAGGGMEEMPAVGQPRHGSALLRFERGHWNASGRVLFNLSPEEALARLGNHFDEVIAD